MAGTGPTMRSDVSISISNLLSAHLGDLDRRHPRLLRPADALAGGLEIEHGGLAIPRLLSRAAKRLAQLRRVLHDLAVDAEALGDRGHVHVRIAEIVVHE